MRAIIGIFAASVLLVSAPATAKEPGWYVGAGAGATEFKVQTGNGRTKDYAIGGSLIGGYQQNEYIAWEGELTYSGEAKDTINGIETKTSYDSWNIGIVAMYPLGDIFSVFGKLGATYGKGEYTIDGVKNTARDGGYTLGFGGGMQFGPVDLRLRYDLQRVRLDNIDVVDKPNRLGLDVLWRF